MMPLKEAAAAKFRAQSLSASQMATLMGQQAEAKKESIEVGAGGLDVAEDRTVVLVAAGRLDQREADRPARHGAS